MKVVFLAGGKGTRISEESRIKPKPMVEIGGKPILWHIMNHYARFGFQEFIVCCGYKGHMIKEYFINYYSNQNNIEIRLNDGKETVFEKGAESWKVTLVDTGLNTLTAGRVLRIQDYVKNEPFMLTYGDGVSDINIARLLEFHQKNKKTITISTTRPPGRFGTIKIDENTRQVLGFREKAREEQGFVNIGFMVMKPEIFSYLGDGSTMLETEPFEQLVKAGEMAAYSHDGFWSPMDNIHDREYLESLWNTGEAPWR